jgi:hypothetical protein
MEYAVTFLLGFIGGIITSLFLPARIVNAIDNNIKVKKSVVVESEISTSGSVLQSEPIRSRQLNKKPGLLKRIFKRKKI